MIILPFFHFKSSKSIKIKEFSKLEKEKEIGEKEIENYILQRKKISMNIILSYYFNIVGIMIGI